MHTIADLLALMTDEQRAEARALLDTPTAPPAEPPKRTPLDLSAAEQVSFVATLADDPERPLRDRTFVGRSLWFKGVRNARGPQGGVYLYGVVAVGVGRTAQKGMLKIADRAYEALLGGGTAAAWVTFAGQSTATLIGHLTDARVPTQKPAVALR